MHKATAKVLESAGYGLIATLPVLMVFANRSSPLLLVLAMCGVAGALALDGALPALTRQAVHVLRSPFVRLGGVALAWAGVSLAWSPRPDVSIWALGELAVPLATSIVLALCWRVRPPANWFPLALSAGLCLASLLIVIEMKFGFPLRALYGGRLGAFVENRPTLTVLLLAWPGLLLLNGRLRLLSLSACMVCIAAAVIASYSGAAKLGLIAGTATAALAALRGRLVARLLTAGLIAIVCIQPYFGTLAATLLPDRLLDVTAEAHSRERIAIWQSFEAVVRQRPMTGLGFGTSAVAGQSAAASHVAPERKEMLGASHAHNAPLQVWVELGLPGTALLIWALVFVGRRLETATVHSRIVGSALLASVSAVGMVGHGAWQGWWIAAVGLACALLSIPAQADSTPIRDASGSRNGEFL